MLKRSLMFILLVIILIPTGAQAQYKLRFASVEIDLWPEYDRSSMLVIYQAQIASDVDLSPGVDITFRIPAVAGEPTAVATSQPGEALQDTAYVYELDGVWAYVTINTSVPIIQVEFYDALEKQDSDRHYEFVWIGEHDADAMLIQVQKPIGASQMSIEPDLGEFQLASDGLDYYNLEIGATAAGKAVTVSVDYEKEDDTLSYTPPQQAQPSVPNGGNVQEKKEIDIMSFLPWMIAWASLAGIAIIAYLSWSAKRKGMYTKSSKNKRRASSQSQKAKQGGKRTFCHNCGQSSIPGDKFCRGCGTKLR
ncbi:MAG: hypothetical protein B6I38_09095 [Anaerolineaceae bacterium 4572_5.1]|nr:MAG: hypothetical protein B6I38_09095 [Anaerolineaceae bacterium 4572_5.1]